MARQPFAAQNIRQTPPEAEPLPEPAVVMVAGGDDVPMPEYDSSGNVVRIKFPDGSVEIAADGGVLTPPGEEKPTAWFDNLVDKIAAGELSRIAEQILRGISDDEGSRKEWLDNYAQGIKLMGTKIELPQSGGSTGEGAPVEGISQVRHPLLLEAVLRFQANARSELLPTDGPAKIRVDDNDPNTEEDQLADDFENDFNHYLTVTASEFYPDTDRMLFLLGFSGTSFKKVYFCPLRNRPVSETVEADDLIVSNMATDLKNARRVTHRTFLRPTTIRRLQILGVYKDVALSVPQDPDYNEVEKEKRSQEGIALGTINPDDRDREILECYCELDILGLEHKWKGKASGLEVPYRVAIDKSSRMILEIVRNYDQDKEELPEARQTFVQYLFLPGFGFYGLGLLHLLGNTTNAVTAGWREMLDAGMFASFPGFLYSDVGGRQNSNIFRVPPGGGAAIKTGGMPISDFVAPLPYKDPSGALMTLIDNMATTGRNLGGVAEMQVAEGRADVPVGTILAQIEQAQKIMNSVHKRLHAAQATELQLIAECFRQHPDSFWKRNKALASQWDEAKFLKALDDYDLIPQADPNTASHLQRMMKAAALGDLAVQFPNLVDPLAVMRIRLRALDYSPEQIMPPPEKVGELTPEQQQAQAETAAKKQDSDARMLTAQTDAQKAQADVVLGSKKLEIEQQKAQQLQGGNLGSIPDSNKQGELQLKQQDLSQRAQSEQFHQSRAAVDDENRDLDRQSDMTMQDKQHQHEQEMKSADIQHDILTTQLKTAADAAKPKPALRPRKEKRR